MLCGSAFKNKGVQPMLDAVVDYLPSPLDIPPTKGTDPKSDEQIERKPSEDEPFAALAFKIVADPYGKLTYFRIYSGKIEKGVRGLQHDQGPARSASVASCACTRTSARTSTSRTRATSSPGSASSRPRTGDTLCDARTRSCSRSMEFPEPVISVAIEPKTKHDQDKLGKALGSLSDEDPTFRVNTDDETGQTIIRGMGELHLEVLVDRMMREFNVEAHVGKPQVAYRETITVPVEKVEQRYVRQTGGRGQYGHVVISLEPTGQGGGYEFVDEISGGVIPRVHPRGRRRHPGGDGRWRHRRLPARRHPGALDVRLVPRRRLVRDGLQDRRFDGAQGGVKKARPVLLEPMMEVEVVTPEDYMGDVIGDLNSRRGQVEGMEQRGSAQVIRAGSRWRRCSAMLGTSGPARRARDVHDAVRLLPAGSGVDRAGDRRPGSRRVITAPLDTGATTERRSPWPRGHAARE